MLTVRRWEGASKCARNGELRYPQRERCSASVGKARCPRVGDTEYVRVEQAQGDDGRQLGLAVPEPVKWFLHARRRRSVHVGKKQNMLQQSYSNGR